MSIGLSKGTVITTDVFSEARDVVLEARAKLSLLGFNPDDIIPIPHNKSATPHRRVTPVAEAAWHRDPSSARFLF